MQTYQACKSMGSENIAIFIFLSYTNLNSPMENINPLKFKQSAKNGAVKLSAHTLKRTDYNLIVKNMAMDRCDYGECRRRTLSYRAQALSASANDGN
jgi:hypothetical protein